MNKIAKYILRSAIPFNSIARAGSEVAGSVQRTAERVRATKEALARQKERIKAAREVQLTPEQLKMSPQELFQDRYQRGAWTKEDLARHRSLYRQAKWACYVVAAATVASALWMIVASGSPLLSYFVAPLLLTASLFIILRGAIEAWKQAQLELREIFSFVHFLSRDDFFKHLIW